MSKIIFADIDGTLVHKSEEGENLIQVPNEGRFISEDAVNIINKLRKEGYRFAIITGRRRSGYERLAAVVPHDYAVIEHGCVILKEGEFDLGWAEILKDCIGDIGLKNSPLWQYEQQLLAEGYKTDSNGRFASFRLFLDKPDNLTEEQKVHLEGKVAEEVGNSGITTTRNQAMFDVLPKSGGKSNAINYLMKRDRFSIEDVIVLGDDVNDISMMEIANFVACPGNAKEIVKQLVREKHGYISPYVIHKGTVDILEQVGK